MSHLEQQFALQIKAAGLPEPEREVCLIPGRRYRVDFVWRSAGVVFEVEGGIWRQGGGSHSRPANIKRDIEKGNALTELGYRVYRVHDKMLDDGSALALLERALVQSGEGG